MKRKQKITLARITAAGILTVAACFIPLKGLPRLLLFALPYLIAGYNVLWGALRNILHGRILDEQFLMAVATLGAFAIGDYPEASAVMIFYQVGELFQSIAVGKSRRSIASLMDIRPDYAVVVRDGEEIKVSPDKVAPGEIIVVRPGEKIPLDGEITDGATTVNTAALTGESLPADRTVGEKVISGSLNLSGVIRVRTEGTYSESTAAKILELVENSSSKKAKVENFITRFAKYYTPCVVGAALLLAFVPPLLFSQDLKECVYSALSFLVVSCPCALVVSVPMSFFGGIGGAARNGILIKGANYLEVLASADTVVFDKTGTLTKGSFAVEAVHPSGIDADALIDIAAVAESYSTHPVGESVVAAHKGHIEKDRLGSITEHAGLGIEAEVDGVRYYIGNGKLMDRVGATWHECHLSGTVIHIANDQEYLGHIVINDEVKPDSAQAIRELRRIGITKTVMLTGDSEKAANRVRDAVGVDEVRAQLLPAQKVGALEELISSGRKVAFVGDGINDAPVLARADVGVAMGALGSDAAIEAADVVLMDDKPSKIPVAIGIARKTMRIVRQNIVFSLAVKAIILILSALRLTNMWFAVFGDVGVMVLAILNSTRTIFQKH
ncbi:MAG: heavy metal translocating P-type ATPase [Eubacteriales bacterium]